MVNACRMLAGKLSVTGVLSKPSAPGACVPCLVVACIRVCCNSSLAFVTRPLQPASKLGRCTETCCPVKRTEVICAVVPCAVLCCAVQAAWDALQLVLSATPQGFVSFTNPLAEHEDGDPHSMDPDAAHSYLGSNFSSSRGGCSSCHGNSSSSTCAGLTSEGARRAYSMLTHALSFEDLDKVRAPVAYFAGSSCMYVPAEAGCGH
jgi:hypothetical protein